MLLQELPESVRVRVLTLAATALGSASASQVPPGLTAVARFAPSKRVRYGSALLAKAIESDPAFRVFVAHTCAGEPHSGEPHSGEPRSAAPEAGREPLDDVGVLAQAYLRGSQLPVEALDRVSDNGELARAKLHIGELQRAVAGLTAVVAAHGGTHTDGLQRSPAEADQAQIDRLRGRLREQGTRVRRAEQVAEHITRQAAAQVEELTEQLTIAQQVLERAQSSAAASAVEAERAKANLAAQRDSGQMALAARDRRIELLLTSITAASLGLRREWELASGGELPADAVARQVSRPMARPPGVGDPTRLRELLAIPGAHLIVDGYNVTKTGYPELTLADQRGRLIRSLSSLAARISTEITVVFDGAAVTAPAPTGRKIRVLFSPPTVIADDVIRRLVAAEPQGRLIAVATSDRAVANDVARSGAHVAGSEVLLGLLGRSG